MPAWYDRAGVRHDCVELVRFLGPIPPANGQDDLVAHWDSVLQALAADVAAPV